MLYTNALCHYVVSIMHLVYMTGHCHHRYKGMSKHDCISMSKFVRLINNYSRKKHSPKAMDFCFYFSTLMCKNIIRKL